MKTKIAILIFTSFLFAANPQILSYRVEIDSFKILQHLKTYDTLNVVRHYTDSAVVFDSSVSVSGCKQIVYNPQTNKDTLVCNGTYIVGRWKHTDSAHDYTVDTLSTITWNGQIVFSCLDADADSMGVFIDVNIGSDTISADSTWGESTTFTGMNKCTYFRFSHTYRNWTGSTNAKIRLSLDDVVLGYNRISPVVIALSDTTVSINDNVNLRGSATDAFGYIVSWAWDIGAVGVFNASSSDTTVIAPPTANENWLCVLRATDNDGNNGYDTVKVNVVQDIPVVYAGTDTTVTRNTLVTLNGTFTQQFGYAVEYLWDFNGDGIYDATSTVSPSMLYTYAHAGVYNAKLAVRDDDENEGTDIRIVTVPNIKPIISFIRADTIISIKDSINFAGTATDPDGTIQSYSWDYNGDGVWDSQSSNNGNGGYRYNTAGIYKAVLQVVDNEGGIAKDTATISVLQDVPIANAGNDINKLYVGAQVVLHGQAIQQFGTIIKWEWKIGSEDGFIESSADTIISYPSVPEIYCVLRVTDDDGNVAVDTIHLSTKWVRMKSIPAGIFQMGKTGLAVPVHTVNISSFSMDSTEVTQGEYQRVMGRNPSHYTSSSMFPVEYVTWFDAVLYCNARGKLEGRDTIYSYTSIMGTAGNGCTGLVNLAYDLTKNGYRLPTEGEWEYACRAGTTTDYFWGDVDPSLNDMYAWPPNGAGGAHVVGSKLPNSFGLYDMSSSVWEWCNDWYGSYDSVLQSDPVGPSTGSNRILRGGSEGDNPTFKTLRSAYRYGLYSPNLRDYNTGFRVVCKP